MTSEVYRLELHVGRFHRIARGLRHWVTRFRQIDLRYEDQWERKRR